MSARSSAFTILVVSAQVVLAPVVLAAAAPPVRAEKSVVVAGAGPSTAIVQEFFTEFTKLPAAEGYAFVVPPRSIKHAGGLRAAEFNLFGRTGRHLTDVERGDSLREIPLARIPITFVIDPDVGVAALERSQLEDLLAGRVTNWSQLGGADVPVRLVGREPSEAALLEIAEVLPAIAAAEFDLILKRDHQLVELMETEDRRGMLGFGVTGNFDEEYRLRVVGFEAGLTVGLVHHRRNDGHPLVAAVRAYSRDEAWLTRVADLGYMPAAPLP